jgi:hypothetical protein
MRLQITLRAEGKLWDDRRLSARQVEPKLLEEIAEILEASLEGQSRRCFVCN